MLLYASLGVAALFIIHWFLYDNYALFGYKTGVYRFVSSELDIGPLHFAYHSCTAATDLQPLEGDGRTGWIDLPKGLCWQYGYQEVKVISHFRIDPEPRIYDMVDYDYVATCHYDQTDTRPCPMDETSPALNENISERYENHHNVSVWFKQYNGFFARYLAIYFRTTDAYLESYPYQVYAISAIS